jgi:hypothetical protein
MRVINKVKKTQDDYRTQSIAPSVYKIYYYLKDLLQNILCSFIKSCNLTLRREFVS